MVAEPIAVAVPDTAPANPLVRGLCPCCGREVVSALVYVSRRGYLCIWHCVRYEVGNEDSPCLYRIVL